jgi:eukaryotic-like serine/threonine-protein kinase
VEAGDLVSGKYRLQRLLGAGSMGSVWAARNELTNRDFAVKFLRPDLAREDEALQRFFLEARACGQIRHPAIVDVYDMGQADDSSPYLVMELLEGEGFDQRLARQTRLRPVDVCRYLAIVSRGLEEAHTRGLVHRDLKPGNIFFAIDKGGDVFPKVLDFGVSKETSADFIKTNTGAVLGSPAYMSPEQAGGELDVDARSDIWALGVIMYESLTGQLPFDANNYNALMVRIINEPHVPVIALLPEVPEELSNIVDACLAKDRRARIGSAGALADRLERVYVTLTDTPLSTPDRHLSLPPIDGTTQHGWFRVTPQGKRRLSPAVWLGTALATLGIAGGVALAMAATPSVPRAARVGAAVRAAVAQAEGEFTAADARKKTEAAETAAREAERRAIEAEKQKTKGAIAGPRRPVVRPVPPPGNSAHGGVSGPGF